MIILQSALRVARLQRHSCVATIAHLPPSSVSEEADAFGTSNAVTFSGFTPSASDVRRRTETKETGTPAAERFASSISYAPLKSSKAESSLETNAADTISSFPADATTIVLKKKPHKKRSVVYTVDKMQQENDNAPAAKWKKMIIDKLNADYDRERMRYAAQKNTIRTRSRLVSYICDERLIHMLSYVKSCATAVKNQSYYNYDDEFFAIALKFTALQYKKRWADSADGVQWAESHEAYELFHNFCHFVEVFRPQGNDARVALALAVDWARRWAALSHNAHREDVLYASIMLRQNLTAALINWSPIHNPAMFTDAEFLLVSEIAVHNYCGDFLERHYENGGYSAIDSPLARRLEVPVPRERYLGSPFILANRSEDDYIRLFREQLAHEEETNIRVKNFTRTSKLDSMERMMEKWGWKSAIAQKLKAIREGDAHFHDKAFLNNVDVDVCAARLLDCVQAAMCKGQSLVSLSELEHDVCRVILGLVRLHFLKSIACQNQKIFIDVFADYLKYYTIEEISRSHTIREWWSKCAASHKLKYDFYSPFSDLFNKPPTELAIMLITAIMDACTIPDDFSKSKKPKRINVFSYRNVVFDEESFLLIGDDRKTAVTKMIALHSRLIAAIDEHQFDELMFPCRMLPMKVPPRPWTDFGTGGPFYTRPQEVLRNLYEFRHMSVNAELRKRLKNAHDARPVFDALNDLGATPWIINRPMLAHLMRAFQFANNPDKAELLSILSVPRHPDTISVPNFAATFGTGVRVVDVPVEQWREFSKRQFDSQKLRNELFALWCSLLYRLLLAQHYIDDCLYFPHNMDFRGRVYPISPHLNHMGDDINRGLLKFAKGKKLGENGFRWLKLHCVNMTGLMKREPISRRLEFADEKLNEMIDSAERPFDGNGWWLISEEPWQTLAACMEIRDALNCPDGVENFVSHLPIHQDGSCNGLQHYAALGRDFQGGFEVNLVPHSVPTDVYSSVVERVEQKRREHEQFARIARPDDDGYATEKKQHELALALRAAMPQVIPRKVLKQTVMTTVYGVTYNGATKQIRRQLKTLGLPVEECLKFSVYLANQMFECLDEAFTNSMLLKKWLQNCTKTAVHLYQPIQWVTPLGLPVVQPYVEAAKKFDRLYLHPIHHKQVNAFPPNFVHSLDSTHMMLTTLHCRRRGITFAAVHDCFWTHACDVDAMGRICREQFISLHSEPIIKNFADFLQKTYLNDELRDAMSQEKFALIQQEFTSNLEPGKLDIEAIRDSIYFFS